MPRIRQYADNYRKADFLAEVEKGKFVKGIKSDRELAQRMGMSAATLCQRRKNVDNLTIEELRMLINAVGLPGAAVMALIGVKV